MTNQLETSKLESMPENTVLSCPLIVENNQTLRMQLQSSIEAQDIPPILAESGKQAQLKIADQDLAISGIFINPEVGIESTISVIRFTHFHRPTTPIFILLDGPSPFEADEAKHLGIEKFLDMPITYKEIIKLATPIMSNFDNKAAENVAQQNTDQVDRHIAVNDQEFIAIKASNFMGGTKSAFDIYVRLSSGRFIKLIQAGDAFSPDRVTEYINKGVQNFFLRKEAQEVYLAYCDRLASALLKKKGPSLYIKASQTLNHGEETLTFFRENGISASNIQYASNFVSNVNQLVSQLEPGKKPLLNGFLNDLSSYSHGVSTSMIAALIIRTLDITSAEPTETVGIASLLHDIGLYELNIEPDAVEDEMTAEQKKEYLTHPTAGGRIVRTISGIKPVVIQAIEQHHERRNRKGFPLKLGPGSLSMVSEIVGMSDEFSTILMQMKKRPDLDIAAEVSTRIISCFSGQLVTEFKKVFTQMSH